MEKTADEILFYKTKINEALQKIRGYLKADGGDVSIYEIKPDLTVILELHGACASCSMSDMTMKAGIEQAIKNAVPDVTNITTKNTC